jgi:hypothetical protein
VFSRRISDPELIGEIIDNLSRDTLQRIEQKRGAERIGPGFGARSASRTLLDDSWRLGGCKPPRLSS